MVLYLACTPDKYELPVFVCDTVDEMAAFAGIPRDQVFQTIARKRKYDREGRTDRGGRFHMFRVDYGTDTVKCPVCGAEFKKNSFRHQYCSRRCYDKKHRAERKEERHDSQG